MRLPGVPDLAPAMALAERAVVALERIAVQLDARHQCEFCDMQATHCGRH